MFVRRGKAGPDPWLEWKVALFSVGAGLGLAGIYFGASWLVTAAVVVLFGGMILRFLPVREEAEGELEAESE